MGTALDLDSDLAALADARNKARRREEPSRRSPEQIRRGRQYRAGDVGSRHRCCERAGTDGGRRDRVRRLRRQILKNLYNTQFVAASMLCHAHGRRSLGRRSQPDDRDRDAHGRHRGHHSGHQSNFDGTVQVSCRREVGQRGGLRSAPRAARCSMRAAEIMADAAVKAGAPRGLISCLSVPTIQSTGELMRHPDVIGCAGNRRSGHGAGGLFQRQADVRGRRGQRTGLRPPLGQGCERGRFDGDYLQILRQRNGMRRGAIHRAGRADCRRRAGRVCGARNSFLKPGTRKSSAG